MSPPEPSSLTKALQRTRECLALAESGATNSVQDTAAIPLLMGLMTEIEAHLPSGAAPPPPRPADLVALPPPSPVELAPGRFALTLPLSFGLAEEKVATAPPARPVAPQSPAEAPPPPAVAPPSPAQFAPPAAFEPLPSPFSPPVIAPPPAPPFDDPPEETAPAPRLPFIERPREMMSPAPLPALPFVSPAAAARDWRAPAPLNPAPAPALADPNSGKQIVSSVLAKLAGLYYRRGNLLRDLLTPWHAFKNVEMQLEHAIQSMKWNGDGDTFLCAEAALASAEDDAERFAAVLGLLQAGDSGAVFTCLVEQNALRAEIARGPLLALRISAEAPLLEQVDASFASVGGEGRVSILTALAARGRLSADRLVALLEDPSDDVAAGAAELLAWFGRSPIDADAIELRLHADQPARRRCSLLFAAIALGSEKALQELRRTLDAGLAVTTQVIDALAIAGDATDADRLLDLAARQPELGDLAVLAAGHLGTPAVAKAIASIAVEDPLRNRALRTIQGDGVSTVAESRRGRLLYGAHWTVPAALAQLSSADELLRARPWYALEAAVRTGARPLALLDRHARASVQEIAVEQIRAGVAAHRRSVPEGSWYYFGRSQG